MKLPAKITVKWLAQTTKGFDRPNAHRFLSEKKIALIPEDIFAKFLAVRNARGDTTLHSISNDDGGFKYVAKERFKFLSPSALRKKNKSGETPLTNALASPEEIIPWKKFERESRKWIPFLSFLEDTQQWWQRARQLNRFPPTNHPGLAGLIKAVKIAQTLKAKRKINGKVAGQARRAALKHP